MRVWERGSAEGKLPYLHTPKHPLSVKQDLRSIRTCVLLLAIVLAAFALRVYRLDYASLRGDESFTVLFVQKPFAQMWNEILTVEPNPPLLYLLLRGWVLLAGAGEFATRYFSVFWGVLCVPLIYRLARELFIPSPVIRGRGRGGGLIAAFLIAINPYQIWHSQDVRNYTLWPALSLLALVFFWQWRNAVAYGSMEVWEHERKETHTPTHFHTPTLVLFLLAELAALYTHYYETFILLALNLYMLFFFARRWKRLRPLLPALGQWVGAQVTLALLYLPFPLLLSNRVASYGEGSGQQGVALWDIWRRTFSSFTLGETLDAGVRDWLWVPFALALGLIVVWRWRRERRGLFFLLYAGVPTLAVFVLNLSRPLFLERYLNGIAPAYYLLFAWGLAAIITSPFPSPLRSLGICDLRRGTMTLALAVFTLLSLLALTNYFYDPAYTKSPDWRGLAQAIDAQRRTGDVILQNFPETSLVYYDRSHLPLVVYPQTFFPDQRTPQALDALNARYQRVWFIPAAKDFWDPNQFVETWLDQHDDLLAETHIGTFRLELYSTPAQFLKTLQPAGATLGDFVDLVGYRLQHQGTNWHLVLYWRARATTNKAFRVSVQSRGTGNRVLAELEQQPVANTFPTDRWQKNELVVDAYDVPFDSQARTLAIAMRDPETGTRLAVTLASGQAGGHAFVIPLDVSQ
jgi:4-amino-4-deoxy-L-arabinose transferase-like glycosyltransferase